MFSKQKYIDSLEQLKIMQSTQVKDDYSRGLYNGLEMAMAVLQERDPCLFIPVDDESVTEVDDGVISRTCVSGIRKVSK